MFLIALGLNLYGQQPDTVPVPRSSRLLPADTIPLSADSLIFGPDTIPPRFSGIRLSKDSLDAPVAYSCEDSMIYDIAGQKIHLFGTAQVAYQTITLKAAHIVFDWSTNIVTASGLPDSLGRKAGLPEFADGDQQFTADSMRYNFDTRKGIVYDVRTEYTDIVVHGAKAKFVSGTPTTDTTKANDIIYNQNAIFTTCTAPEPHFGIRSKKQKVIPDKLVVVGPSNLEIMGVPTPLWLPFGFFPMSKGRSTGLLFPRDYEYSAQWGFGLRDIGWFFPLGDHVNLSVKGNIYVKGTWGLGLESQYAKRYKYTGRGSIAFDQRRSEDSEGNITRNKSFSLRWTHNQAATANPTSRFGGSINFQTNDYQSRVYNDAESVLQSQLSSNFSYSKTWPNSPFSMSLAFNHSQNTKTQEITVNFPTLDFQTSTMYPFRSNKGGKRRWYEDITLRYKMQAKSTFRGQDSVFFTRQTLDNAQYGAQQDVSSGTSFKILKWFSLNPNISYKEVSYFRTLRKDYLDGVGVVADTTTNPITGEEEIDISKYGTVVDTVVTGLESYRTLSGGVSLTTQIFGTLRFNKGKWLRGLRHVIKPTFTLGYQPDYLNNPNYYRLVRDPYSSPDDPEYDQYSIFEDGIYGRPPSTEQQMALSYSITNIFEGKYWSKKDSTEKKFKLFDNIYINGQYNFAADTLKWSRVNVSGATRFFKGITTVSARAVFDPYVQEKNENGSFVRVNKLAWRQKGKMLDFVNASANINTRVTVSKIRALFQGQEEEVVENVVDEEDRQRSRRREETDFLSLFENFSINHTISLSLDRKYVTNNDFRDTFNIRTHSIDLRGNIDLTEKWRINISRIGYDFIRKQLTYPSLMFSRDLHCWEMSLSWAPTRGTYAFSIRVKPGTLDFIKLPYDRNNADAIRAFQ
ncbi:MAG: putative LPS assembly protein LptD [Saprospiraceae bacterium]